MKLRRDRRLGPRARRRLARPSRASDPAGSLGWGLDRGERRARGAWLGAGRAGWSRGRAGPRAARHLCVAAGFAWFLVAFDNPRWARGVGLHGRPAELRRCPAARGARRARLPGRAPDGRARARRADGRLRSDDLVLGLPPALVFDPAAQGCSQCPPNHLALTQRPGLFAALERAAFGLGLVWAPALAGARARRIVRSSSAARLLAAPVLLAAVVYLGLVAAALRAQPRPRVPLQRQIDKRLWAGPGRSAGRRSCSAWCWRWARGGGRGRGGAPRRRARRGARARRAARRARPRARDPELRARLPLDDGRQVDAAGHASSCRRTGER